MAHMVESMFSGSMKTPWHKLGNVVEGAPDAARAVELAGAGWTARREPLQLTNAEWRSGEAVPAFALVRDTDAKILTVVSPTYEVFQYREAFGLCDDLRDGGARFESAGVLDEGRRAWVLMRMRPDDAGDEIAPGDVVRPYLLVSTGHGGDALKVAAVTTRVVCMNTLRMALAEERGGVVVVKHTRNMRDRVKLALRIIERAEETRKVWTDTARRMAEARISVEMALDLAYSALDVNPNERDGRAGAKRDEVRARVLRQGSANGTVWGAVNAVTEFTSKSKRAGRSLGVDRLMSGVDGTADHANQKAWTAGLALVGG